MAKYVFPAVFHPEEEGGFSIFFPDIEGCYTQGDSVEEGLEMANDVLPLMLTNYEDHQREIPVPSAINDLEIAKGDFATLISCDTTLYRRLMNNLAVKKAEGDTTVGDPGEWNNSITTKDAAWVDNTTYQKAYMTFSTGGRDLGSQYKGVNEVAFYYTDKTGVVYESVVKASSANHPTK